MRAPPILLAVLLAAASFGDARAELQSFVKSTLAIETAKGPQRFAVELALSPAQQEQGLMFRRAMAPDAGMLFVFSESRIQSFWMHNTLIPLDMLFIAADGRIVDIHERAVPLSDESIVSKAPARAVLELNGGTAARLGIAPGDVVRAAAFGNAAK